MANRAYLFATETDNIDKLESFESPYYDSRWVIPILWFLFFNADSVKLKTVNIGNACWQELILFETKEKALASFENRLPLIKKYFEDSLYRHFEVDYAAFFSKVKSWSGKYLVINGWEIIQENDASINFRTALQSLEELEIEKFIEHLQHYTGRLDAAFEEGEITNFLIGFTYR